MSQNTVFQGIRYLFGSIVVLAIMILSGCSSMPSSRGGDFNSKGLPYSKYKVGGGLDIKWSVPARGTAYLVEEKTGKIVMTKSYSPGQEFKFSPGSSEPEKFEEIFGVEVSESKFSLYFIPAVK